MSTETRALLHHDHLTTRDEPHGPGCACSRRGFLSCGAWIAVAIAAGTLPVRKVFAAAGEVVGEEPFARVEKIADGVWAVVSTPMQAQDFTTVANGGIIAGRDGVLLVEGLNTPRGGAWLYDIARTLTGRPPTHVAVTHHHGDHANGLPGQMRGLDSPRVVALAGTRRLLAERNAETPPGDDGAAIRDAQRIILPDMVIVDESGPAQIDLGGRTVRLVPRVGHTPADLTVEIDEPRVVYCGDLVFNRMFPYYGDAIPSRLTETCRSMLRDQDTTYVPGHGALATAADLEPYIGLLEDVGVAARRAHEKGVPADQAWREYEVPASLGEWFKFRPDIFRFAFEAWERELNG